MNQSLRIALALLGALAVITFTGHELYEINGGAKDGENMEESKLTKTEILENAEFVVRCDFTGIENIGHAMHEYYAVCDGQCAKVTEAQVKKYYADLDLEASLYDDDEKNYYLVQLEYCPDGTPQFNKPVIEIGQEKEYVVAYSKWTRKSEEMSDEAKKMIASAVLQKNDFSEPFVPQGVEDEDEEINWYWRSGARYGLDSFMFVEKKGEPGYAVLWSDSTDKVYTMKGDELSEVMDVPERGRAEYVYFLGK